MKPWRCTGVAKAATDHSSTISVDNSGLLAAILPTFTKEAAITVHVLAQGTGQALATAARDDADLVLVHDPEAEERFIADGHGIERAQIAWNDFVVVGRDPTRRMSQAGMMRSKAFVRSPLPALRLCRGGMRTVSVASPIPGPSAGEQCELARARRRGWRRRWRHYVAGKALRNSGALRDRQRARRLGLGVFDDQRRFGRRGTHCRLNTTLVSNVAAASRVAANSRSSISRARLSAGINPKTSGSTVGSRQALWRN
jgi:hypothetical protein